MKKLGSCSDLVEKLSIQNVDTESILYDIMNTNFKSEIVATRDDFQEIDRLITLDDIEFETSEQYLMEQIYDFIDRTELSAEQIIQGQLFQEEPFYVSISKQFFL
jgi:hypothetical protein